MTLHACKHCSQAFEDPDDMRVHISQNHQHQCSECGKMFLNVGGLNTHQIHFHGKAKKLKKTSDIPKVFKCEECDKAFVTEKGMKTHQRDEHLIIVCTECGKCLPSKRMNRHYLKSHTPEDKKPYVYQLCDPVKGFVEQNMYEDHMNVHMGKKPHICHLCPNAAYASQGNLFAHMRATH